MVHQLYLFSSSKGMVKTGHIGHDGSFIGLRGVDDVLDRGKGGRKAKTRDKFK